MSAPGGQVEPTTCQRTSPRRPRPPVDSGRWATPRNLVAAIEQVEKELIVATLDRTSGNISETARVLGLTRRGLYLKIRRLGLDGVAADT